MWMRSMPDGYFPMQNVKFIDNQWATKKCGRNVVHKIHKKTATKLYKSAYTDASVTPSETCSSTSN